MKKLITLCCSIMMMAACQHYDRVPKEYPQEEEPHCSCPELQIALQPYEGFSLKEAETIKAKLEKEMPKLMYYGSLDITILPTKQLPSKAYSPKRGRYLAKEILAAQKKTAPAETTVIGLTIKDLAIPAHGMEDWGIMGLSYRPGNVCIVSSHRVKPHKELWKVVVHEYLHSWGLPHCPNNDPACIMNSAYPKAKLTERTGLCKTCSERV